MTLNEDGSVPERNPFVDCCGVLLVNAIGIVVVLGILWLFGVPL